MGYIAGSKEVIRNDNKTQLNTLTVSTRDNDYLEITSFLSLAPVQGTVAGFTSGGFAPPNVTTIDKFPFSQTSGTATDIGDLSQARSNQAGQQD